MFGERGNIDNFITKASQISNNNNSNPIEIPDSQNLRRPVVALPFPCHFRPRHQFDPTTSPVSDCPTPAHVQTGCRTAIFDLEAQTVPFPIKIAAEDCKWSGPHVIPRQVQEASSAAAHCQWPSHMGNPCLCSLVLDRSERPRDRII